MIEKANPFDSIEGLCLYLAKYEVLLKKDNTGGKPRGWRKINRNTATIIPINYEFFAPMEYTPPPGYIKRGWRKPGKHHIIHKDNDWTVNNNEEGYHFCAELCRGHIWQPNHDEDKLICSKCESYIDVKEIPKEKGLPAPPEVLNYTYFTEPELIRQIPHKLNEVIKWCRQIHSRMKHDESE